jgi:urease accessory protein
MASNGRLRLVMRRAYSVRQAGQWDNAVAIDRIVLDADQRHRRRSVLTAERGTTLLLDLPHATTLKDGDGLVLEDGALVRVIGKPEPLYEIAAANAVDLARFAWHLGNRHADVQVVGERLRIRRDHVLAEMLERLGAQVSAIEAAFDPESGAYDFRHEHERGG